MSTQNPKAIPVVTDVIIVGEAIVGGTLKGSYRYANESENPEGQSLFKWTVGGSTVSDEQELRVIADYANKPIIFFVTPVAESGEIGAEGSSEAKTVISGFQNITDEENINSFMKQHGNFSFYTPEPADRIFVSTGGAFSLIDAGTQSVHVKGQDEYGAKVPDSIKTYLENNPATVMFSTERDFAAVVPLGRSNQMLTWGTNMPANQDLTKLRDIRSVYANGGAFVYIYNKLSSDNKWIGALGSAAFGGTVPDSIHLKLVNDEPMAVYATYKAFAVRTKSGKVYAWGDTTTGGTISKDAQAILDGMKTTRMIANMNAFCAIDDAGSFATWGQAANGGTIPADKLENILDQGGVKSIIAARSAFCAVTKGRAKAVSWGNAQLGGNMNAGAAELAARGNIVLVKAATWAFCMVNATGQADAWGEAGSGGTIPNKSQSYVEPVDFGELMDKAGVKADIEKYFRHRMATKGIPVNDVQALERAGTAFAEKQDRVTPYIIIEEGYVSIYANDSSFFLTAQDEDGYSNQILVWGQANGGGKMSDAIRQALMASQVTSVYCTNGAYGVICNQGNVEGTVVVWGATLAQLDAGEIPEKPPELKELLKSGIIELYSIKRQPPVAPTPVHVDPSFAARHKSGAYGLWGGNVDNQVFTPEKDNFKKS